MLWSQAPMSAKQYLQNIREMTDILTKRIYMYTLVNFFFMITMTPAGKESSEGLKKISFNLPQNCLWYKIISNVILYCKISWQLSKKDCPQNPSILTARYIRTMQRCVSDETRHTTSSLAKEISSVIGNSPSVKCVHRRLVQRSLHRHMPCSKLHLTTRHKWSRLFFDDTYVSKVDEVWN